MAGIGHLLAETEMQKEALSLRKVRNVALGVGGGGLSLVAGGAGYFGHRYGRGQAERDFHAGLPGQNKPGVGTFLLSGIAGLPLAPITAPAGLFFSRRSYKKRLAELQERRQWGMAQPHGPPEYRLGAYPPPQELASGWPSARVH